MTQHALSQELDGKKFQEVKLVPHKLSLTLRGAEHRAGKACWLKLNQTG